MAERSETNYTVDEATAADLELLRESRDEFDRIARDDGENRSNALDDLKFKVGDQWLAGDIAQRTQDQRPILTINQLPQFIDEVVNEIRRNPPQIKIGRGENGDPDTAKTIDGLVREIQYKSAATAVYASAAESQVSNGFGYFRVVTDYCDPKSFDQQIRLQRIPNPLSVYYGEHINPDGSDVRIVFVTSYVKYDDFKRDHPDARFTSWESMAEGEKQALGAWYRGHDEIRVAERFRRKFVRKTLLLLKRVTPNPKPPAPDASGATVAAPSPTPSLDGGAEAQPDTITIFDDEPIPPGYVQALRKVNGKDEVIKRESLVEEIWWYKLTAHAVLEKRKLDGCYIPIIPVWGKETNIEGKVIRSGLIRQAKDSMRSFNYWFTVATELIALAPKAPFIGPEGFAKGHEARWAQANRVSFPYLEYAKDALVAKGGQILPPPARQPFAEMPQGVMQMMLLCRENLRTTIGKYQRAELAPDGPEQSGSALREERQKGELSSYNYTDNLARAVEFAGRVIVDLVPPVYGRVGRKVLTRGEDGGTEYVELNTPDGKRDVKKGDYNVVVSVGPAFSTRRQEGTAAKLELLRMLPPQQAMAISDLVARGLDTDDADRMADRLKALQPPEIKALEDDADETIAELPPKAREIVLSMRSQMVQMKDFSDKLQQALQEAAKQLDDKGAILSNDRYKADSAAGSRIDSAAITAAVKLATDQNAQQVQSLTGQVTSMTAALTQVTGFISDMQKRSQELAQAQAQDAAKASAGPVPASVDPNTAAGVAQPAKAA